MINLLYGLTIFLSAFLLFFIQPMIAKIMLPIFGGSSFVWLATILFFQIVLLVGYAYAYGLTKYFSTKTQIAIHIILLITSLYYIPVHLHQIDMSHQLWSPLAVLWVLTMSVMLPCIVISASSPLLQHWYCNIQKTTFPYAFYAISNAGSLIGLLSYPFLLEPLLGLKLQSVGWSVLYGIYFVLCLLCVMKLWTLKKGMVAEDNIVVAPSPHKLKWLVLTFLSSALLLSITQFLVQNVINMPLIWVLPLSLYLISYIVVFAKPKNYDRQFWAASFLIWLLLTIWLILEYHLSGINAVIVVLALLFSACMVCHGELIKLKPINEDLTLFYLYIALGGVLGGIFANIIALLIFQNWWDLYLPLIIINGIIIALFYFQYRDNPSSWNRILSFLSIVTIIFFGLVIILNTYLSGQTLVAQFRNPYGFIKVLDYEYYDNALRRRALIHGKIMHGLEFMDESKLLWPTTYYGHSSGVGKAFDYLEEQNKPLKIGIVGLGAGTLAGYAKKGDEITFYEIDKDIQTVATEYFKFLSSNPGKTNIVLGDARIELQNQLKVGSQQYNMLIVDAFNGDAIPAHLLTVEAMQLYMAHIVKNGIIALHTTNTYLDFMPITLALAKNQSCSQYWIQNGIDVSSREFAATWALISCDPKLGPWLQAHHVALRSPQYVQPMLWTDDFNSVLPLLKLQ
ncbi:MAG: fused MFS/spermidine synthase [Gammaproteobacteria bacterium]|jgi:hypothetical protein|nr:fused MFS/spermidine synthase [Gammaproteobacteria bacterium]